MRAGSRSICTALALPGFGMNSIYGNDEPTISSVSQLSRASCEGLVPRSPMPPVVKGLSSGTAALPSNAFTMVAKLFRGLLQCVGGMAGALAGQNGNLFSCVEHV